MPMLKTRYISRSGTPPSWLMLRCTGCAIACTAEVSKAIAKASGNVRCGFSQSPPPVMWAIAWGFTPPATIARTEAT